MNDDEFEKEMARLRAGYVGRMSKLRGELIAAVDAPDRQLVQRISHRLKGTAGSYGFAELSRVAGEVEAHVRDDVDVDLGAILAPLLRAIDAARV